MAKVVVVRVKEKEPAKPEKKNYLQLILNCVTAIVAVLGICVSFMSLNIAKQQNNTQREVAQSDRLTYAVERLQDDSLAIRMEALNVLEQVGLESPRLQQVIVRILNRYIREGIENRALMVSSRVYDGLLRPQEDIFVACDITSLLYEESGYRISLQGLDAKELDLSKVCLKGADLWQAKFVDTCLSCAQFQEANFTDADLKGVDLEFANLVGANLKFVQNLTARQVLLSTHDFTTTEFSPGLWIELYELISQLEGAK